MLFAYACTANNMMKGAYWKSEVVAYSLALYNEY